MLVTGIMKNEYIDLGGWLFVCDQIKSIEGDWVEYLKSYQYVSGRYIKGIVTWRIEKDLSYQPY